MLVARRGAACGGVAPFGLHAELFSLFVGAAHGYEGVEDFGEVFEECAVRLAIPLCNP